MTSDQPFPRRAQSVEHRLPTRRLVERLGRRDRGRTLHGRHGLRHRRLDPQSGGLLRHGRHQADLWSGRAAAGSSRFSFSLDTGGPMRLDHRGLRPDARRAGGPRSQRRRPQRGRPRSTTAQRAQRPIKGMRIALAQAGTKAPAASCSEDMAEGHGRGRARDARPRRRGRGSDLPRHLRLSHLRPRHHHDRGACHPSPRRDRGGQKSSAPRRAGASSSAPSLSAEQYISALRFRRKLQQDTREAMRGYDLVDDGQPVGDRRRSSRTRRRSSTSWARPSLSMPFNVTGQPAASVCCGFGGDGNAARLPARRPCLRRSQRPRARQARFYERATPWRFAWPPRPDPGDRMARPAAVQDPPCRAVRSSWAPVRLALPVGVGMPVLARADEGRALRHLDGRRAAHHRPARPRRRRLQVHRLHALRSAGRLGDGHLRQARAS